MIHPKVSIIIPIYNAEPYIEKCAETLFSQTLNDIEYIFVDDCSPDKSIEKLQIVLNKFPHRKNYVKIIKHEINKGVSQTRQDGVDLASGEYIIHCDPDDWVEPDMYEQMYNTAVAENADIVSCNFFIETSGNNPIQVNEYCSSKNGYLCALISDRWATLWRTLIKSDIAHSTKFTPGINAGEDYIFICKSVIKASKIVCLKTFLYHYNRSNSTSIISTPNFEKIKQQELATIEIEKIITQEDQKKSLNRRKFNVKKEMLKYRTSLWHTTFPEVKGYDLPNLKIAHRIFYWIIDFIPIFISDIILKIILKKKRIR